MPRFLRTLVMLVLVVAVGVGGLYVGSLVRDRLRPPRPVAPIDEFMTHALMPGADFPDVSLRDPADGVVTTRVLTAAGSVVLFIDPDCSPCTDMGARWQRALDEGAIEPELVWAVSYQARHAIDAYAVSHDFTFPIYEDRDQIFRTDYGVKHYPLEIVVGMSGAVRGASYDSVSPIDVAAVKEHLAR